MPLSKLEATVIWEMRDNGSSLAGIIGCERQHQVATKEVDQTTETRRSGSLKSAEIYLMVTTGRDEFTITSQDGSLTGFQRATLDFRPVSVDLFFKNGAGWTKTDEGDETALHMLANGHDGTIDFGEAKVKFSADGFLQAYASARAHCEVVLLSRTVWRLG